MTTPARARDIVFTRYAGRRGLAWLAEAKAIRLPEVLGVSGAAEPPYLALELLVSRGRRPSFDEELGQGLAALHPFGAPRFDTQVFEQATPRKERQNSYATPTPCTDGRRVYAVFGAGGVAAVGFDGKLLWTNREIDHYSRHGLGASPLLVGGLLVVIRWRLFSWRILLRQFRLSWVTPMKKVKVQ